MIDKIRIIKEIISAAPRRLTAKWTYEDIGDRINRIKPVKDMTKEEEADEIIRRLSQPYKTSAETLEDELAQAMSAEITKEIDNEIIKALTGMYAKRG